ncbi:MAG TPA: DUF3060 domain-containing protein [Kofleriaceae bacterium]|nr:DUF3060 domain-containing protein [Kofleriaceae bacterium]
MARIPARIHGHRPGRRGEDGGDNTIAIGTADTINVNGSDNKVTYRTAKSGKVTARSPAGGNTIEQAR